MESTTRREEKVLPELPAGFYCRVKTEIKNWIYSVQKQKYKKQKFKGKKKNSLTFSNLNSRHI